MRSIGAMRRLRDSRPSSTIISITRPMPAACSSAFATMFCDRAPLARRFEVATQLLGTIEQPRRVTLDQIRGNGEQVVAGRRGQLRPAPPIVEPGGTGLVRATGHDDLRIGGPPRPGG